MKEQLYTIPLNDAMDARDECPFCFIERAVERDVMDFVWQQQLLHGSRYPGSHGQSGVLPYAF